MDLLAEFRVALGNLLAMLPFHGSASNAFFWVVVEYNGIGYQN
jgi:hypothetical protein